MTKGPEDNPVAVSTSIISDPYITAFDGEADFVSDEARTTRLLVDVVLARGDGDRDVTVMVNGDHEEFLAHRTPPSTSMYFVLTVCELIRLNKLTVVPDKMHEVTLRDFAVFLLGLDMIPIGGDSNAAMRDSDPGGLRRDISSFRLKVFAFAVPPTYKYLNEA